MNQKLLFARAYEREASRQIPEMARPKFHLSPCTGWMNDPNGFSFYKGEYHLFYQYNPYDTCWDTMHWGHAVSGDLLSWRYLPAAMAPNEWYDADGCWSGSAMEMPDGRQLLMYTGNRREGGATRENLQVQCLALGDGIDYEKYAGNPVLTAADLPDECSPYDFRDPSIWRESDGTYRAIVGTCTKERLGKLLLFSSEDGLRWRFESVFAENDGRLGLMSGRPCCSSALRTCCPRTSSITTETAPWPSSVIWRTTASGSFPKRTTPWTTASTSMPPPPF